MGEERVGCGVIKGGVGVLVCPDEQCEEGCETGCGSLKNWLANAAASPGGFDMVRDYLCRRDFPGD